MCMRFLYIALRMKEDERVCLDKGEAFSGNSQGMSINMVTTFPILKFSLMCWKLTCSPPISNGSIASTMSSRKCLYLSFSMSACTSDSSVLYLVGFNSKHVFHFELLLLLLFTILIYWPYGGSSLGLRRFYCIIMSSRIGRWGYGHGKGWEENEG